MTTATTTINHPQWQKPHKLKNRLLVGTKKLDHYIHFNKTEEKNRGRGEVKSCYATQQLDWLDVKDQWRGLESCIAIESRRTIEDKESVEIRYYISSLPVSHMSHIERGNEETPWGCAAKTSEWSLYFELGQHRFKENLAIWHHN